MSVRQALGVCRASQYSGDFGIERPALLQKMQIRTADLVQDNCDIASAERISLEVYEVSSSTHSWYMNFPGATP